jgi:glycine cleavage system aminomethyltransferase T
LRLEKLVEEDHGGFNGRAAYLASLPPDRIVGVELDSQRPAPDTVLYRDGVAAGRMMTSLYSPALQRAIGWAQMNSKAADPGTRLSLSPEVESEPVVVRVADLPFLPAPVSIEP